MRSVGGVTGRVVGLLCVLLLQAGSGIAQIAPDSARLAVKFSIAQMLLHAYELEAEYRCGSQLSLSLAPHVVRGTVSGLVSPEAYLAGDQVQGYGGSFGPRYYFSGKGTKGAQLAGWYVGLRGEYQQLRLRRDADGWGEDLGPDGLRYYVYRRRQSFETIRRSGGVGSLGFQGQALVPRLRFDVAANLHYLRSRSSAADASLYRTSRTDYAYSGLVWTVGVGLGFVLD